MNQNSGATCNHLSGVLLRSLLLPLLCDAYRSRRNLKVLIWFKWVVLVKEKKKRKKKKEGMEM